MSIFAFVWLYSFFGKCCQLSCQVAGLSADIDPEHVIWKVPRHAKAMGERVCSPEGWRCHLLFPSAMRSHVLILDISHNLKMLIWPPQTWNCKMTCATQPRETGKQTVYQHMQRHIFGTFQANGPCLKGTEKASLRAMKMQATSFRFLRHASHCSSLAKLGG